MDIQKSIEELLYRYNCVILPEFGAFLTQMKSAVIQENTNALYPPTKVISFNEQLSSNDGLLVSYIAESENIAYNDMLKRVVSSSELWRQQLKEGQRIILANIGELWLNKAGKIQFQPSYQVNYLTTSFGLASFVATPIKREVLKEEVVALEEKIPFIFTPEQRKNAIRPYLRYAAVVLLAISIGFAGYRLYDSNTGSAQLVQQQAQEKVAKSIQEATFFNKIPLELPSLTLDVVKKTTPAIGKHQIVAGAFRVQENADRKVLELRQKGYNASYIGVNKYGLHMVTFDSFDSVKEALNYLREIKRNESPEAWLLSSK